MQIDYKKAYNEDAAIRRAINAEKIQIMSSAVQYMSVYPDLKNFTIVGTKVVNFSQDPTTENWQKTIGQHQFYGIASININKSGKVTMLIQFHMEDMYNFNRGMADIASGAPDDENGRFAQLGWAKGFKTIGDIVFVESFYLDFSICG